MKFGIIALTTCMGARGFSKLRGRWQASCSPLLGNWDEILLMGVESGKTYVYRQTSLNLILDYTFHPFSIMPSAYVPWPAELRTMYPYSHNYVTMNVRALNTQRRLVSCHAGLLITQGSAGGNVLVHYMRSFSGINYRFKLFFGVKPSYWGQFWPLALFSILILRTNMAPNHEYFNDATQMWYENKKKINYKILDP